MKRLRKKGKTSCDDVMKIMMADKQTDRETARLTDTRYTTLP